MPAENCITIIIGADIMPLVGAERPRMTRRHSIITGAAVLALQGAFLVALHFILH